MKKFVKVLIALILLLSLVGLSNTQTASAANAFIKPNNGSYTSYFGYRTVNGVYGFHAGVDIGANGSTLNIAASAAGTVRSVTTHSGGLGKHIVLRHTLGGKTYDTVYGHLSAFSVSVGQTVSQGQKIGTMGTTGYSTGTHLHFEIHPNGRVNTSTAVDPIPYLNGTINPAPDVNYHQYDGTWAVVKIVNPTGGSYANLFEYVGYGIKGTLPVGNTYKVYGHKEYASNGDLYYNVGPGYIHGNYGEVNNHHAVVSGTITTYNSPNGTVNRSLASGTYRVHAARDGWYDLGASTWVKADQIKVIKNP